MYLNLIGLSVCVNNLQNVRVKRNFAIVMSHIDFIKEVGNEKEIFWESLKLKQK